MNTNSKSNRASNQSKAPEDVDGGGKPLAATLLQEFQNLREKLKNEDEYQDKGKL